MNKPASYKNPWHNPGKPYDYGPENYSTSAKPVEYRGFLIYHRLPGVWDVVKNGTCVTQMAGQNGARSAVDDMLEDRFFFTPEWLKGVALQS